MLNAHLTRPAALALTALLASVGLLTLTPTAAAGCTVEGEPQSLPTGSDCHVDTVTEGQDYIAYLCVEPVCAIGGASPDPTWTWAEACASPAWDETWYGTIGCVVVADRDYYEGGRTQYACALTRTAYAYSGYCAGTLVREEDGVTKLYACAGPPTIYGTFGWTCTEAASDGPGGTCVAPASACAPHPACVGSYCAESAAVCVVTGHCHYALVCVSLGHCESNAVACVSVDSCFCYWYWWSGCASPLVCVSLAYCYNRAPVIVVQPHGDGAHVGAYVAGLSANPEGVGLSVCAIYCAGAGVSTADPLSPSVCALGECYDDTGLAVLAQDTDGDGYANAEEAEANADPSNPASTPWTDDDCDGRPNAWEPDLLAAQGVGHPVVTVTGGGFSFDPNTLAWSLDPPTIASHNEGASSC